MSNTDDLIARSEGYAARFEARDLPRPPARKVAVVTCMDARVDPQAILGTQLGDAHVIRNPGGVVTDNELRALAISQRELGTEEVMVIQHTDCGLVGFDDHEFRAQVREDTGAEPGWSGEGLSEDLEENVRRAVARVRESPFVPVRDSVRGFVYDVKSGRLREVS